jgi:hypothetical protein
VTLFLERNQERRNHEKDVAIYGSAGAARADDLDRSAATR